MGELSDIGKRIELRRIERGLTKEAVQRAAKISPNTYYRLLKSDLGKITFNTLQSIADTLGFTLIELIEGDLVLSPKEKFWQMMEARADILLNQLPNVLEQQSDHKVFIFRKVVHGMQDEIHEIPDYAVGHLPIDEDLLLLEGHVIGLLVGDESMQPQYYKDDMLVIWYGSRSELREIDRPGDCMVITDLDGQDYIGHCSWDTKKNKVFIRTLNPTFADVELDIHRVSYIGLVVMYQRGFFKI